LWYMQDYWHPSTLTRQTMSIEDVIFAFALGGLSYSIYKLLFHRMIDVQSRVQRRYWLILLFGVLVLALHYVLFSRLGVSSVIASAVAFITYASVIWYLRPDLRQPSIVTAILILLVFVVVYNLMLIVFPNLLDVWCTGCNPSGIRVIRVNIEELCWDF